MNINGIFNINDDFINLLYERTKQAIDDGIKFEKDKKEEGFPSDENIIEQISTYLSVDLIKRFIEICFVASLEKEEGRLYNFSISLTPPENNGKITFQFQNPIEFNPFNLTKLIPAINPDYYSINVWLNDGKLEIKGFSKKSHIHYTVSTVSPGNIILDCSINVTNIFKVYISLAVTGLISLKSFSNPVADWLMSSLTETEKFNFFGRNSDLAKLILHMFSHGNGGTLLFVLKENNDWKESIQQPVLYGGINPFGDERIYKKYLLIDEYAKEKINDIQHFVDQSENNLIKLFKILQENHKADENLDNKLLLNDQNAQKAFLDIGSLTKIDGATILTQYFEVLAFGARIKHLNSNDIPESVVIITPFENCTPLKVKLSEIGGTRHQSAAQFVYDQKKCVAVVASHDGRLSALWWDDKQNILIMMKHYEAMII